MTTEAKPIMVCERVPVRVPARDLDYEVHCGPGVLDELGAALRRLCPDARRVALVTDDRVGPLHARRCAAAISTGDFESSVFEVPEGEGSKNPAELQRLIEGLVDQGFARSDLLVTLGGGVVGDLGGLAAASFMRGIDFVQVPTSLLAQVDASVGGKVAVDLPSGKNLWGAFHFPRAVFIDTDLLETLEDRHVCAGMAEMLKHGALFDPAHLQAVVSGAPALRAGDAKVAAELVARSVALKAACVSRDPEERTASSAGRVVLNLGHTVGHALESLSGYELLHGEAVGLGLLAAARISVAGFGADPGILREMEAAVAAVGLPTELDKWLDRLGSAAIVDSMARDKKRGGDARVTFVLLEALGRPRLQRLAPAEIVPLLRR